MLDSKVVDVGIGLVLMFFLLALASSSIVEAVAGVFNIRGKKLEAAIKQLVSDPKATLNVWETSVFGAISAGTDASASATKPSKAKKQRKPSYVSARAFADATIEAISKLKAAGKSAAQIEEQLPVNLRNRLDAITNEVGDDLTGMKAGLETWYDETMERTAGAFKRWSQIALVFVALGLVVATNSSTTRVATMLWNQSAVRDAVVQSARNVTADKNANTTSKDIEKIGKTVNSLPSLGLPVGWKHWDSQTGPVGTIAGWLITALLVMLGAPFWYGLLTRLVSMRTAGTKPPTATNDHASATNAIVAMTTPPKGTVTLNTALEQLPTMTPIPAQA